MREREGKRKKKGQREDLPSAWLTLQRATPARKREARDSILVSHGGDRNTSTWAILHCIPRCISRELTEVEQPGLEMAPQCGMLALQPAAGPVWYQAGPGE